MPLSERDECDLLEAMAITRRVLSANSSVGHGEIFTAMEVEKEKLTAARIDREVEADRGEN
jgi:hypothetical protein